MNPLHAKQMAETLGVGNANVVGIALNRLASWTYRFTSRANSIVATRLANFPTTLVP